MGRLGLVTATATLVHPGYTGIITLELANLGDTPIALYPGVRIAQLVLHKIAPIEGDVDEYMSTMTYKFSTRPSYSRINEDEEMGVLSRLRDEERYQRKSMNDILKGKRTKV